MSNAEFLALVLVLVYVGAVMTLFLFVVMMLNIDTASLKRIPKRFILTAIVFLGFFMVLLWKVMPHDLAHQTVSLPSQLTSTTSTGETLSNTSAIGRVLYTDYMSLIEITALLLLVAIVASITLVHRGGRQIKRQSIKQQLMVRKSDRVKIIKLETNLQDKG
jgi:NADH-quinone oxidoreductase subunit J